MTALQVLWLGIYAIFAALAGLSYSSPTPQRRRWALLHAAWALFAFSQFAIAGLASTIVGLVAIALIFAGVLVARRA